MPPTPNYLEGETAIQFNELHESTFESSVKLNINSSQRRKLLDALIIYYKLHFPGFGEIKSIDILKTILS
jgi:DNA repair protein RecO (recombination protein O)